GKLLAVKATSALCSAVRTSGSWAMAAIKIALECGARQARCGHGVGYLGKGWGDGRAACAVWRGGMCAGGAGRARGGRGGRVGRAATRPLPGQCRWVGVGRVVLS